MMIDSKLMRIKEESDKLVIIRKDHHLKLLEKFLCRLYGLNLALLKRFKCYA